MLSAVCTQRNTDTVHSAKKHIKQINTHSHHCCGWWSMNYKNHINVYSWSDCRHSSHLLQRKDEESSAPAGLYDDGNKLGVDGTEGAVPRHPGDTDVIVALVVPHRLAKDVTELALSHNSPQHICGEKTREWPFYQKDWSYKIWKGASSCRRWLRPPQSQHSLSELRFTFINSDLVCAFACRGDKIILENMSFIFLQLCLHHYLGAISH